MTQESNPIIPAPDEIVTEAAEHVRANFTKEDFTTTGFSLGGVSRAGLRRLNSHEDRATEVVDSIVQQDAERQAQSAQPDTTGTISTEQQPNK